MKGTSFNFIIYKNDDESEEYYIRNIYFNSFLNL